MDQAQVNMTKAILWEEAKGKLRAMVMAEAWRIKTEPMTAEMEREYSKKWLALNDEVERVISDFQNRGLSE